MLGSKNGSILISNWTRHVSQCLKQVRAGKNQKISTFVTSSESVHANASSSSSSPQSPSVLSESSPLNQSILSSHLPRHSSTPLSSPQPLQVTPPSQLESPEGDMSANPCMFRSQRSHILICRLRSIRLYPATTSHANLKPSCFFSVCT